MDSGWLDWLANSLGPMKEHLRFLVFPDIETDLEIGADTYFAGGAFPDAMLSALEAKDSCYFSQVTSRGELPKQTWRVFSAIAPYLRSVGYANQISSEIRIKDDKAFYIDATQRGGMPSSASQQLLWRNFSDIVWAGAHGELVQPEPDGKFSIECMVKTKTAGDCWDVVKLPKELDRSVRFSHCAFIDGCYVFPPSETRENDLGWLCAIGDSPTSALESAKELCDQLPDGLEASVEDMVQLIEEVESAKAEGIELSSQPMPEIEDAIS